MNNKCEKNIHWDFYSWVIIAGICIIQVFRWHLFPFFMDMYYHLDVMSGFAKAGGYVPYAFWEYAPVGRIHLYPPLLHIIMMFMFKAGLSPLFIARALNFAMYPIVLMSVWFFGKKIFNSVFAFGGVLLAVSSYYFYLDTTNSTAFSLAVIMGMAAVIVFNSRKMVAAAMLLGLIFYTHTLAGCIFFISIAVSALVQKKRFFLVSLAGAAAIALPILIFQAVNRNLYHRVHPIMSQYLFIHIGIYACALIGIASAIVKKKHYVYLLGILTGFFLLGVLYKHRFLSGEGVFAFIMLGAAGFELIAGRISRLVVCRKKYGLIILTFSFAIACAPSLKFTKVSTAGFAWDSAFVHLFFPDRPVNERLLMGSLDSSMYNQAYIDPLVKIIRENTKDTDIIFSNIPYAGGMLSAFSGRATSVGMLPEVNPPANFDPLAAAKLSIWFKNTDGSFPESLKIYVKEYNLIPVAETELAYVYRNDATYAKIRVPPPLVPMPVLAAFLLLAIVVIVIDLLRSPRYFCSQSPG